MSNRSLRRSVAVLALAALLAPVSSLHAAQSHPQSVRPSPTQRHNPVIQFLLGLLAAAGVTGATADVGVTIDGNG